MINFETDLKFLNIESLIIENRTNFEVVVLANSNIIFSFIFNEKIHFFLIKLISDGFSVIKFYLDDIASIFFNTLSLNNKLVVGSSYGLSSDKCLRVFDANLSKENNMNYDRKWFLIEVAVEYIIMVNLNLEDRYSFIFLNWKLQLVRFFGQIYSLNENYYFTTHLNIHEFKFSNNIIFWIDGDKLALMDYKTGRLLKEINVAGIFKLQKFQNTIVAICENDSKITYKYFDLQGDLIKIKTIVNLPPTLLDLDQKFYWASRCFLGENLKFFVLDFVNSKIYLKK